MWIIMQLVVNTFLHLGPKPFFLRRTFLVRVFTNRTRDHRIRHGRGICGPTHRSYRTFVVVKVGSGEFTRSLIQIHSLKLIRAFGRHAGRQAGRQDVTAARPQRTRAHHKSRTRITKPPAWSLPNPYGHIHMHVPPSQIFTQSCFGKAQLLNTSPTEFKHS